MGNRQWAMVIRIDDFVRRIDLIFNFWRCLLAMLGLPEEEHLLIL
jgi:hypothetical protein